MAMRLQVEFAGRKEGVSVGSNTTMQAVLEEACRRRALDPTLFALKHKRALLEPSLSVRFSGLSPNAVLELVEAGPSRKVDGACNIALQLEDGERKTFRIDTSTLLAHVNASPNH